MGKGEKSRSEPMPLSLSGVVGRVPLAGEGGTGLRLGWWLAGREKEGGGEERGETDAVDDAMRRR